MTETLAPIDDERLTAFALNEIDAAERAHIEAHLKNNPSAQKTVDDIRATAGLLACELKQERFADLAKAKPIAATPVALTRKPTRVWTWLTSAAAVVTVGLLGYTHFYESSIAKKAPLASLTMARPQETDQSAPSSEKKSPDVDFKYADNKDSPQSKDLDNSRVAPSPRSEIFHAADSAPSKRDTSADIRKESEAKVALPNVTKTPSPALVSDDESKAKPGIRSVTPPPATLPLPAALPPFIASGTITPIDPKPDAVYSAPPKVAIPPFNGPEPVKPATIPVPADVSSKARVGDHFETIQPDKNSTQYSVGSLGGETSPVDKLKESGAFVHTKTPNELSVAGGKKAEYAVTAPEQIYSKRADGFSDYDERQAAAAAKRPAIDTVTIPNSYTFTPPPQPPVQHGGETYPVLPENEFESVRNAPLSTFSADVDTASYANVRRFLGQGQLPPPEAVRVEELINYFKYNYTMARTDDPFSTNVESAACPWNTSHRLVRVAVKSHDLVENKRPASNLVFLIDVSGSMDAPNRLPLVKDGIKALVRRLGESDRVAIVTYAGESGIALQSTNASEKERIIGVIDSLRASGGTNGGAGIQSAYSVAKNNFIKGGVNRVILATDGDFNVGVTSTTELVSLIEAESRSGVFLTALGYGMGNYKDAMLQKLADKGHGNYAYIDNAEESHKALIEQMNATLVAVAKDVKFQVEFNPARVSEYRLIGYEKRAMPAQDFNNDAKDAGVLGAGHTVTAFYEVVPTGARSTPGVDGLKYQPRPAEPVVTDASPELLTVKIRYKSPEGNVSKRLEIPFTDKGEGFERATPEFRFAASVALFGQVLRHSQHIGNANMKHVVEWADDVRGPDEGGYRREFIQLARKAGELRGER